MALSVAAASVWAKSDNDDGDWLPLWRHLDDTAGVAGHLWDHVLPRAVRDAISRTLPDGDRDGRALVTWLAGTHDVGKISPAFTIQCAPGARRMADQGLVIANPRYVGANRSSYRHELASMQAVLEWLDARGWEPAAAKSIAVVVGSHHGRTPSAEQAQSLDSWPDLLGDGLWREVRNEHLDRAVEHLGLADRLPAWTGVRLPRPAQVLCTGIVIMADWIASDDQRFVYGECIHDEARVANAMHDLALAEPWAPAARDVLGGFARRFGLAAAVAPRPIQLVAAELAAELPEPALILIEAPMGEGKTEAALLAAEVLAARFGAGGVFVGLPSRVTANAIFARTLAWLRNLAAIDPAGTTTVTLAHGKAALDDRFSGLTRIGRDHPGATDTDRSSVVAVHQWMSGRKKALLANFAVGTIDQFLLAALKAKHLMLRHLAFAGKIVILDEVHAYDAYMSAYLEAALEWLAAYRVPVVALSATLPADRRAALVRAYERGNRGGISRRVRDEQPDYSMLTGDIGYPVITASSGHGRIVRAVTPSDRTTDVVLSRLDEGADYARLVELLRAGLADGGCAVVIRNTVGRVQQTAEVLRDALDDTEIIVTHSRFLAAHRQVNDERLLALFGREGSADRSARRYVVVASQVVEQSLDVDFDLMVTDLAPIDLVLQRMGRLHRHNRPGSRSARLATARCYISGVDDWHEAPIAINRIAGSVYSDYILLRTAAVLMPHLDGPPVGIPRDLPGLVQRVYGPDDVAPADWRPVLIDERRRDENARAKKIGKARAFQLDEPYKRSTIVGWLDADAGDYADESPQASKQVRDSDESLEALVVRRMPDRTLRTMPDIGPLSDVEVPVDRPPWRALAKAISRSSVTLPPALSNSRVIDAVIRELERDMPAFWQDDALVGGELVLVLDDSFSAILLDEYRIDYTTDGLTHRRVADIEGD